jgi:small subunit ribosomal protein S17
MTEEVNNTASAPAETESAAKPEKRVLRLEKVGKVVSDKMDKTVVVEVDYLRKHRLYKKAIRRTSRFKVHDEKNECRVGDVVRIVECRPLSKEKHFMLAEIIKRSDAI